jgi:hypothetical protein
MADPQPATLLLVELRRLIFVQDAATHLPIPMEDGLAWNPGDDSMRVESVGDIHQAITAKISYASDVALVAAYRETSGIADELEVKILLGEIRRRNIEI